MHVHHRAPKEARARLKRPHRDVSQSVCVVQESRGQSHEAGAQATHRSCLAQGTDAVSVILRRVRGMSACLYNKSNYHRTSFALRPEKRKATWTLTRRGITDPGADTEIESYTPDFHPIQSLFLSKYENHSFASTIVIHSEIEC